MIEIQDAYGPTRKYIDTHVDGLIDFTTISAIVTGDNIQAVKS